MVSWVNWTRIYNGVGKRWGEVSAKERSKGGENNCNGLFTDLLEFKERQKSKPQIKNLVWRDGGNTSD